MAALDQMMSVAALDQMMAMAALDKMMSVSALDQTMSAASHNHAQPNDSAGAAVAAAHAAA